VLKKIYFKKHMYCCMVFDGDGVSHWKDDKSMNTFSLLTPTTHQRGRILDHPCTVSKALYPCSVVLALAHIDVRTEDTQSTLPESRQQETWPFLLVHSALRGYSVLGNLDNVLRYGELVHGLDSFLLWEKGSLEIRVWQKTINSYTTWKERRKSISK